MKTAQEIRNLIEQQLATIETIAKEIRCGRSYSPVALEFDAVARTIKMHTDRVKDLAYELSKVEAVKTAEAVRS